ncbi:MAG: hypothetical protein WCG92_02185 [Hyphomicrobiales bacterium]
MPQLMFRCPYTNKAIRPGIELARELFQAMMDHPISMDCPHCGRQHHGNIADGCLDEPAPPLVPSGQ